MIPPNTDHSNPLTVATYKFVLPILCIIGLVGNLLSVFILSGNKFRHNHVYVYLRSIAWADICYLVCTFQLSFFVIQSHFLADNSSSGSKSMEAYKSNFFPAITNAFATSSDFMILFLTINRFKILRKIESLNIIDHHSDVWIIRYELLLCVMFCFFCHLPYIFTYDIVPCEDEAGYIGFNLTDNLIKLIFFLTSCWTHERSEVSGSPIWIVFTIFNQLLVRIIPMILISLFNVWIYYQLKRVAKARKRWRRSKPPRRMTSRIPWKSKRTRRQEQQPHPDPDVPTVSETVETNAITEDSTTFRSQGLISRWKPLKWITKAKRIKFLPMRAIRELRSSRLILLVLISHLALSTPGNVVYIIWIANPEYWGTVPGHHALANLCHILYVLNYSANFLIYCIGNRNVRKEAFNFFFKCRNLYGSHG